ncbi:cell wall-binding repeat-containing protein [Agromyces humatus]|uniref:D-glucuronyl C5-epimerase C-terminal domain-containing protein n=1 Tax=Agromyces humatus TaxID=279573 RepID=A0ABP4WI65_9MICO|nr:cell wall-binding repeat-containing protein [Agromyces humatus]
MRLRAPRATIVSGLALALALAAPTAAMPTSATAAAPATASAAMLADVEPIPDGVTRLGGASRYETAVAVSQRHSPGVPVVFVASGADFPDALAAASAAALAGGPLLLTHPTRLPAVVFEELQRLDPARISLIGGTGAIGAGVQNALNGIAPTTRLAGRDRYTTGLAITRSAFTTADHAIVATGRAFPDALAATGAAGARNAPVMLVDGTRPTVSAATLAELERLGVSSISIAGGTGAVSDGIHAQLTARGYSVTRYGGATRYDTAAIINGAYFGAGSATSTFLATGVDFPDAIAGAALAGQLGAPLNVTLRSCVHPPVSDVINAVGASSLVVLGGVAAVSDTAASGARCIYPVTDEPIDSWTVSGMTLADGVEPPYFDRPPANVNDPSLGIDATGLRIYLRLDNGVRADHPVVYAQYGLSALIEYERTGEPMWLARALRHAERLTEIRVEHDGAWWYPYRFPWTYVDRTLTTPWWSAMAQGEALSLFTRLAETTGDARWSEAADRTWASFAQEHTTGSPWGTLVIDDHLYFEAFAGNQPPLLVLNTHVFAMFGVYDYWRYTGDAEARRYFDGSATSVLERMLPVARVEGGISFYCVQAEYCHRPRWQSDRYHLIVIWQLDTLARITGDARFAEWADQLRADWQPSPFGATREFQQHFEPGVEPFDTGPAGGAIEP